MRYIVTTSHSDLRVRAEPDIHSRVVGGLDQGDEVDVDIAHSTPGWMKLGQGRWVAARFLRPKLAAPAAAPGPARHLLIFYGGWEIPVDRWEMHGGHPITQVSPRHPGQPRTSYAAYLAIKAPFEWPSRSFAMDPSLRDGEGNAAVESGLGHVRANLWPGGRLVLYGFSAGGFNALNLARRIGRELPQVRVDLLVTVDACLQRLRGHLAFDVQTPSTVVRHVNYFQESDEYKGRSMNQAHLNDRRPTRKHDLMPTETAVDVGYEISAALGQPRPASAAEPRTQGLTDAVATP